MGFLGDDRDERRALSTRDKQILYRNAKKRCQNPGCRKRIEYSDMQVGHKKAWSRGGRTTLKNCLCLCYTCNKLQGTDSWEVFLRKQGVKDPKVELKNSLESLSLRQLKSLAENHNVRVKGRTQEGWFETIRKPPVKKQYISKLKGIVTASEISSIPKDVKPVKKRRRQKSDDFW
jgi:hypothetical protein